MNAPREDFLRLLHDALNACEGRDSALRARLVGTLAMAYYTTPDRWRSVALSQDAVEMARKTHDNEALGFTLHARHFALWSPETVEERLETALEMLEVAEQLHDREMWLTAALWRFVDNFELGNIAEVDRAIDAHERAAAELGASYYLFYSRAWKATRASFLVA